MQAEAGRFHVGQPFSCAMCSPSPAAIPWRATYGAGVDAPTSPSSLKGRGYIHAHASHCIPTPTHAPTQSTRQQRIHSIAGRHGNRRRRDHSRRDGGRSVTSIIGVIGVRRGAQRRHSGSGGGFAVAGHVPRVRGVPVRAAGRSRLPTGGTGAASVRPRVPRGLHRAVAAAAPRVPSLPPPRADRRRRRRRTAGTAAGGRGGACVGAAGDDDSVRLRRREGGVDAQPVRLRQAVTN